MNIPNLRNTESGNFFLMAGPCAIEGEEMALEIAEKIKAITDRLQIPFIFKGSYRKANRSRIDSFTGIGDEKALKILRKVGETFNIPTVTDIHESQEAALAAEYTTRCVLPIMAREAMLTMRPNFASRMPGTNALVNIIAARTVSAIT